MKINQFSKSALVCTVALAIIGGATMASAETVGSKVSNGVISFEEDNSVTPPVNPEKPEKPVEPVDPTDPEKPIEPGTPGPLSIDFASHFNFGTHKISVKDETYYADEQGYKDGTKGPNYVQITDKRGTAAGWSLSVTQKDQFKAGENELKGSALTLADQGLNSVVADEYKPTITAPSQMLTPGAKVEVIKANKNQGMGSWLLYFGKTSEDAVIEGNGAKSVSLFVPASAIKLKDMAYKTELNWELSDVPTN